MKFKNTFIAIGVIAAFASSTENKVATTSASAETVSTLFDNANEPEIASARRSVGRKQPTNGPKGTPLGVIDNANEPEIASARRSVGRKQPTNGPKGTPLGVIDNANAAPTWA